MAERWQQWMPFHIDRWRGSAHVQAMRAAARSGYLYLLATAWQTDDCCVPDDDEELKVLSGLTEEEWQQFGPTIRKRFVKTDDGLRNEVEFEEWNEAKRVFESRQTNARRTHSKRSPHAEHKQSKSKAPCNADTQTVTGTVTTTEKKQKPSRPSVESDPRHVVFKGEIERYMVEKKVLFVWDGSEADQLNRLLRATPGLTIADFQRCLFHRARSPGTPHGDRPRVWLPNILKYQEAPLNEFGKTGVSNGNGKTSQPANRALERQQISHNAIRAAVERRLGTQAGGTDGPDAGLLPEPDTTTGHAGRVVEGLGGDGFRDGNRAV